MSAHTMTVRLLTREKSKSDEKWAWHGPIKAYTFRGDDVSRRMSYDRPKGGRVDHGRL
jgi:hypothetical protein